MLCLILYEKFAVRSTNMKHFSAQVLPVKLPPYFQPHFFVDTDVYQMLFHSDLLYIIGGDAIFLPSL